VTLASLTGNAITLVNNAAKGRVAGGEAETEWRVIPRLTLSGSAGLTEGRYTEYRDALGDHTNQPFGVPRWTANISARYVQPTDFGQISGQVGYAWQSALVLAPEAAVLADVTQKSYGLLNARITAQITQFDAEISLYGTNLADKRYYASAIGLDAALGYDAAAAGVPRIVGIELTKRLGDF
jgi:iron complex outermembrane receptor protein